MKKKLLALAVAGAFAAPVAMADTANVNVYGQLNVAYTSVNNDKTAGGLSGSTTNQISSESSRIGFKGTEDLGGGLNAVWQVESAIDIDAASGALAKRDTFVGLSGESWGTVMLGNKDSTYKTAFRGYDVFADTIADNRSILGNLDGAKTTHDTRNTSSLTYFSPDFSGVKAMVQVLAGAEGATASTAKKGSSYNFAGTYNAGPISAALGYTATKFGDNGTGTAAANDPLGTAFGAVVDDKVTGLRLGGGYKMDAITVNAAFEMNKYQPAAGPEEKWNVFYLGGKFAVTGSDTVKVAYTSAGKTKVGGVEIPQSSASQFAIGADHALSKRTVVYALYTKLDNDTGVNAQLGPIATNAAATDVGNGASPAAFALGIKHSF